MIKRRKTACPSASLLCRPPTVEALAEDASGYEGCKAMEACGYGKKKIRYKNY